MDRFSLEGKVAIVTGAGRGLGRAIALGLAEAGADVVLAARNAAQLDQGAEAVRALGRRALAVPTDVSRAADARLLVERGVGELGRLDILVNNAGISPYFKRVERLAEEEWRHVLDVNLTGTFLACQAASPHLGPGGRVINVASIAAVVGFPRQAAYCASKAGIEALTRVLALEWAERQVTVNAVSPAFVATDLTAGLRGHEHFGPETLRRTPLGRFAEVDDVVGAAIFLASGAAGYITGQTIYVDGGWLAQ